jgi:hypothetical protein
VRLQPIITATVLAACVVAALADEQAGDGVTFLGTGFTGAPVALSDGVILETDGAWCTLRDYDASELPGWIAWYHATAQGGSWRRVVHADGLLAALQQPPVTGLQLLDVSDPTAPLVTSSFTGATYTDALLHQGLLWLAQSSLLLVYDLADPAAPTFRFALPLPADETTRHLCAAGDRVYLREAGTLVRVLDATDPTAIIDLGTTDVGPGRLDALAASPGALHALMASEDQPEVMALALVTQAADGAPPFAETSREPLVRGLGARGLGLTRHHGLLLAATNQDTLRAFDLAAPTQPQPGFVLERSATHLAVTPSRLISFDGDQLTVHTRTGPYASPTLIRTRRVLPDLSQLSGAGSPLLAQSAKDPALLFAVDIADPAQPRLVGGTDLGLAGTLRHAGDRAVMIADEDVLVLDVADAAAPMVQGALRLPGAANGSRSVLGGDLLATDVAGIDAIDLVDLADPARPSVAARLVTPADPLAVAPGLLLVADDVAATLVDVTDPTAPAWLDPLPVAGIPVAAAFAGTRLCYLADQAGAPRLHIWDVADPQLPSPLGFLDLDHAGHLTRHGLRLYVHGPDRVTVVDLADPAAPAVAATLDLAFSATAHLAAAGDLLVTGATLVTCRDDSWRPIAAPDIRPPPPSAITAIYPNPCNPRATVAFTVDRPRWLTVSVHDLRGRRVATLAHGRFAAGSHTASWDGIDHHGQAVASGHYLVRLHGDGLEAARPVTVIK